MDTETGTVSSSRTDFLNRCIFWAWVFVTGALFGVVLWSCTLGLDLQLSQFKSPQRLNPSLKAMNIFFFGGGFLNVAVQVLFAKKWKASQRQLYNFIVWLSIWFVLVFRLEGHQTNFFKWIFFTLPLAWFAARLWWGGLRKKVMGALPVDEKDTRKPLFLLVGLGAFGVYCLFSLTRHYSFGSGSWDMGCYNHNIWLIAHLKPLISTVLGEVHFIGDHFVPILFVLAPLAYTGFTGILLVVQSAAIALGVVPIFGITKHRGLSPHIGLMVSWVYLFSLGTQSMINFDFHEIALVPLALLCGLWALELKNKKLFVICALVIFLSKESAIIYAAGLGFYAFLFAPGMRWVGCGVAAFCVPAFVLVVGVLQPALLEGGPQGMIHLARFKDFGDTVPQALMHMASYPGKAFLTLFIPQVKQTTWLTTLGAYGFLPFLAPETFILMLPNLMERFLSDKREMWGLGFHYSVVWVSLSAYASLVAVHRLEKCLKYIADLFQLEKTQRMFRFTISFWLLLTWLGSMRYAPSTPEFKSRDKKYFSTATQIPINKKAVEMIPSQAKVVAQNHFLPFLAFRQFVWQPQNKFFSKAEYAILNPTESAWPHNKAHIKRWIVRLYRDSQWTLVFSEGTTVIFKKGRFEEVEPSLELFRSLPQLKKGPKVPNN